MVQQEIPSTKSHVNCCQYNGEIKHFASIGWGELSETWFSLIPTFTSCPFSTDLV